MKKAFILPLLILAACSGNKKLPDAYGNFETEEITISAENGGKIVSFPFEEGQSVKIGETIAVIDTTNLDLQRLQLASQRESTEAQLAIVNAQIALSDQQITNLKKDQSRIYKMIVDGAATAKQKDDVDGQIAVIEKQKIASSSQLNAIQKQSAAIKTQIDVLNDKIKNSTIKSPINGTILEKYAQLGELMITGKSVCKIADIRSLILRVFVSENQLSSIKIGQTVKVNIDTKEKMKTLDGKVEWVSSEAEFTPKIIQTREERVKLVYAVKIRVKNDGLLKIGMPGEVIFRHNQ